MSSLVPPTYDSTRWITSNYHLSPSEDIRIAYIDCPPPPHTTTRKGTILLIHGFPQTSYQFRHVITPLSEAGYRVIAPDYRGAGASSKPRDGYTKTVMAGDLHSLVRAHLGIEEKVHVIGHDIGGMVAHAYASRFAAHTASVSWGECPLPGTEAFEAFKSDPGVWHFVFHQQTDLPEALTQGRERIYLKHFYDRLCLNPRAIGARDLEEYTVAFSQPGALRCGFDTYRAFPRDAEENRKWVKEQGKCKVPALSLSGGGSFLQAIAKDMVSEVYEDVEAATVDASGHWCAEENPVDFVRKNLAFIEKHPA